MPASVSLQDVVQELTGLSGRPPSIEVDTTTMKFYCSTSLSIRGGRRKMEVTASAESADLALLKAYQKIFEIPEGMWLESNYSGNRWVFDLETEGWNGRDVL